MAYAPLGFGTWMHRYIHINTKPTHTYTHPFKIHTPLYPYTIYTMYIHQSPPPQRPNSLYTHSGRRHGTHTHSNIHTPFRQTHTLSKPTHPYTHIHTPTAVAATARTKKGARQLCALELLKALQGCYKRTCAWYANFNLFVGLRTLHMMAPPPPLSVCHIYIHIFTYLTNRPTPRPHRHNTQHPPHPPKQHPNINMYINVYTHTHTYIPNQQANSPTAPTSLTRPPGGASPATAPWRLRRRVGAGGASAAAGRRRGRRKGEFCFGRVYVSLPTAPQTRHSNPTYQQHKQ